MVEPLRAIALPRTGDMLAGKYRLGRVLGEGGMGIVFEATHVQLNQRFAIKLLSARHAASPETVMRFVREARAAGALRSRHVVRVTDVDVSESVPYMVMEYFEGRDLREELAERGRLPIDEAVDYVLQACDAMAEAHARGIVHRDLKPSNLLVSREDAVTLIRVLDFGISKIMENAPSVAPHETHSNALMGTPLYMSPEQIRSAKHVDARTDIWSLGVIAYELIVGHTPFGGSAVSAAAAIVADEPAPLRAERPEVSAELEHAIMKALSKDPALRHEDVAAFASALRGGVRAAPSATDEARAPSSTRARTTAPSPSRGRGVKVIVVGIGALLTAAAVVSTQVSRSGGRGEPTKTSPTGTPMAPSAPVPVAAAVEPASMAVATSGAPLGGAAASGTAPAPSSASPIAPDPPPAAQRPRSDKSTSPPDHPLFLPSSPARSR